MIIDGEIEKSKDVYKCDETGWIQRCSGMTTDEVARLESEIDAKTINVDDYIKGSDVTFGPDGSGSWNNNIVIAEINSNITTLDLTPDRCGEVAIGVLCHACDRENNFAPGKDTKRCVQGPDVQDSSTLIRQYLQIFLIFPLVLFFVLLKFISKGPAK